MMEKGLRLGVSSCLLGDEVRYDGQHKLDRFVAHTLGRYVEFVPVCPEVECGLSVPREAMRLVGDPDDPKLVTVRSEQDMTARMLEWARARVRELESENLSGFIFKSKSPSSGMERVKVYSAKGGPGRKAGVGLFAREFMRHFPLLPVEEEGRLHDPHLRENFIERIFVMKRWRDMREEGPSWPALIDFHTRHKLLIMAHSPEHYRQMGRFVAAGPREDLEAQLDEYLALLMDGLRHIATSAKNTNVLQHIQGFFKQQLDGDEKQELVELIENYHKGILPLVVPVTLLNHYVRKYPDSYLRDQVYLHPHPVELQLRNHV